MVSSAHECKQPRMRPIAYFATTLSVYNYLRKLHNATHVYSPQSVGIIHVYCLVFGGIRCFRSGHCVNSSVVCWIYRRSYAIAQTTARPSCVVGLLGKIFRYLLKCKLKRVCSQPCNSNTAAPSVESGWHDNVRLTESLSESISRKCLWISVYSRHH